MTPDTEADLIADLLRVDHGSLTRISREMLGDGSVTGFTAETAEGATLVYLDTSGLEVATETGWVWEGEARVWVHPADPHLPALAPAAFGHAAAVLIQRVGLTATGNPEMVGYRPGRRAVIRVPASESYVWIKVCLPRRVERIVGIHNLLHDSGIPVPAVRGWSPEGLMILDHAAGRPAGDAFTEPEMFVDAVERMREKFGRIDLGIAARPSLEARLPWFADRLAEAAPPRRSRIEVVARHAADLLRRDIARSSATIHGDLHFGQLFLSEQSNDVSGIIDVDTSGTGDPAEDEGAFIAHAIASAAMTGDALARARVAALADAALGRWGERERTRGLVLVQLLGHMVSATDDGDLDRVDLLIAAAHTVIDGKPKGALMDLLSSL